MSIQTDLTRIKNAKAAIKAAIEGKGVTVPDATLLDGMAALIESIEAGCGNYVTGSFTIADESTYIYKITHNFGKIPTFALIYAETKTTVSGKRYRAGGGFVCTDPTESTPNGMFWVRAMNTNTATSFLVSGNSNNGGYMLTQKSSSGTGCLFNGLTDTTMNWVGKYSSYDTYLLPGIEYKYIIGEY